MSNPDKKLEYIRRIDQFASQVIEHCTHAALFNFSIEQNKWLKTEVDGPLFIYERVDQPQYSLVVVNRQSPKNFVEAITDKLQLRYEPPYIFIHREDGCIRGVWVYGEDDCRRVFDTMIRLCDTLEKARASNNNSASLPTIVAATAPTSTETRPATAVTAVATAPTSTETPRGPATAVTAAATAPTSTETHPATTVTAAAIAPTSTETPRGPATAVTAVATAPSLMETLRAPATVVTAAATAHTSTDTPRGPATAVTAATVPAIVSLSSVTPRGPMTAVTAATVPAIVSLTSEKPRGPATVVTTVIAATAPTTVSLSSETSRDPATAVTTVVAATAATTTTAVKVESPPPYQDVGLSLRPVTFGDLERLKREMMEGFRQMLSAELAKLMDANNRNSDTNFELPNPSN